MPQEFDRTLDDYVRRFIPPFTEDLLRLVRDASVSGDGLHQTEIDNVLRHTGHITEEMGFHTSIVNTKGNPALVAHLEVDPSAPWVMVYNHLDVQPAQEKEWKTDPFSPVVKDGKVIGRGATDDKGPALAILYAIHFLRGKNLAMPNIQLVYETEEERGSPNFGSFLDENAVSGLLRKPDSILVSDTIFEGDNPAITYRLRGLLEAELELKLGEGDIHSGIFGGVVENPLHTLAVNVLSMLSSGDNITIPDFYEGMRQTSPSEEEELDRVAEMFDFEKFRIESGRKVLESDDKLSILMRTWCRPTLELHGFEGGYSGPGVKTAIPGSAKAKLTMRLVPDQNPERILENLRAYVHEIDPRIGVTGGGTPAFKTEVDNPFMQQAREACNYGFGKEALFVGSGGTIGAMPKFQRVYPNIPIVLLAMSLLEDGYHKANESFKLSQAERGIRTMARYLSSIASLRNK